MDSKTKISFYWLLMGVCFILHSLLHFSGLFFGVDIKIAGATGEIPLFVQVFNTVINTGTFVMALLAANLDRKGFRWFSFVWSALFLPLNAVHLCETLFVEKFDLSQAALLTFVLVVNVMLSLAIWKSLKGKSDGK